MTARTRCLAVMLLAAGACAARGADPADDNAATFYRQAFDVLPDTSDADWAILNTPDAIRLDETAVRFVQKHETTVQLLRKGAATLRCDWGAGAGTPGTSGGLNLVKARTLASVAKLHARLLFQQGRHAEAMDDAVAMLALSRHVGTVPRVDAKLLEADLATAAVTAAAPAVVSAPPDAAKALLDKLQRVPNSLPPSEVVRREGQAVADRLRLEAKVGNAAVAEVAALYAEAAKHLELSFEQSYVPLQKWEAKRQAASPPVRAAVPPLRDLRLAAAAAETRVQMLFVAAAVRVDGRREVFRFDEPHATGPFTYHEIPGGFELESKLVLNNLPVKLVCKPSGDELPF